MPEPTTLWQRIHLRLSDVDRQIGQVGKYPGSYEIEEVMKARAQELSRLPTAVQPAGLQTVLVFSLAHELYAADIRNTKGVIQPALYSPVPGVPPFVAGVVNHRGMILTVLDLRPFFGLARREEQEDAAIVIAEAGGVMTGILAETIEEITDLPLSQQGVSLLTFTGPRQEYTTAVVSYGERLVAVLNLLALLNDPRLMVDDES